ncbi:MAG: hypothetical protein JJ920_11730 [Roseitalea sp.]|jgi:hypothetical protein|nr:hypothetical protein [Roseitalea sp.]MBO6722958.1 hypothetical protein [Roseitalea sp.]MBO6743576.1 hypothetical protein [Roseitalea sp.]
MPPTALPSLALSVRQPWAWAIMHGGKDIENRTAGSIRAGRMDCRRICIHAASGMRQSEYRWAVHKLAEVGVTAPAPDALVRGAIIGTVDVVDIVTESDSPWFGGPCGLVLENPEAIEPVPAKGTLGYFAWERAGEIARAQPWMTGWGRAGDDGGTLSLFDDLPPGFKTVPAKPFKR